MRQTVRWVAEGVVVVAPVAVVAQVAVVAPVAVVTGERASIGVHP